MYVQKSDVLTTEQPVDTEKYGSTGSVLVAERIKPGQFSLRCNKMLPFFSTGGAQVTKYRHFRHVSNVMKTLSLSLRGL